ncbi:hypothetical protein KWS_0103755, partial [Xanthomonas vasicola pv. musacearum NCPPB 4384]
NNAGGTLAGNGDLLLSSTLLDNTLGTIQHAGIGQLQIAAQTLAGTGGKIISNGTLRVTGQNTDLTNASTSARTIMVATGNLTTAGGQLSASGDQLLKLDVSGTLNNRGGTIGGNGLLALDTQNLINTQGTVQAAGSGQSSLTIARALQNQQGKILLGGDGRITAASVDNQAGTLHAAGGVLQLDVDGVLDNRAQGVVSSVGKLELEAGTLDNTAGTVVAGTDLSVITDTAIGNNNGAIQATNALRLESAGLSNRAGNIIGGNVVVDTRAQQLDNTSGTIGSQVGALDVRSGALNNAGGRLQSKAALLLQTNGQSITNTGSGANGGILAGGGLQVDGGALDNRGGAVFAQGDARVAVSSVDNSGAGVLSAAGNLALTAAALNNAGGRVQGSQAVNLTLAGALDNQGGLVAAGGLLTLNASSVDNRNTRNGANPLGLQAGQLQLQTQALDNRQGQVVTDGAGNLQVTTSLNNTGGQISSGGSLDMRADAVANTAGLLRSDGNQSLTARNLSGDGQVQSQSDLTLTLREGLTNTGEMIANGTLAIHTDGDIANQGVLRAGNIDLAARNVDNAVNGQITSQGITHIATGGQLVNRGLIDGGLTHLQAATLDNVGTGRIYGDHVAIAAGNLLNRAETIAGVTRVATVAARDRLDLGVGQLSNTDRGLIYSDGDAAIGGTLDGNRLATGIARQIDNLGSTIEVAGDLDLHATTINNIRQNVVVTQTTTTLAPVRLDQPSWRNNGPNGRSDIRSTSHYSASEIYYLNPDDILEDSPYITPDGYHVRRAVIRVTPQTSAYFFERGALYSATGQRSRLNPQSGTLTLYYIGRQDNQANPDQVAVGADDPFVEVSQLQPGSPAFHYASDTLRYSNAYGTCTTNCVQLWAQWAYTDPDHILLNPQGTGGGELGDNERYRMATRTIVEDVLQPGAGPEAVIHAGGAMRIGTDALRNEYARIAAGGDLGISGLTHNADITNLAYTLYRTSGQCQHRRHRGRQPERERDQAAQRHLQGLHPAGRRQRQPDRHRGWRRQQHPGARQQHQGRQQPAAGCGQQHHLGSGPGHVRATQHQQEQECSRWRGDHLWRRRLCRRRDRQCQRIARQGRWYGCHPAQQPAVGRQHRHPDQRQRHHPERRGALGQHGAGRHRRQPQHREPAGHQHLRQQGQGGGRQRHLRHRLQCQRQLQQQQGQWRLCQRHRAERHPGRRWRLQPARGWQHRSEGRRDRQHPGGGGCRRQPPADRHADSQRHHQYQQLQSHRHQPLGRLCRRRQRRQGRRQDTNAADDQPGQQLVMAEPGQRRARCECGLLQQERKLPHLADTA